MLRKVKDLLNKSKGQQFNGINNSEKMHEKALKSRTTALKTKAFKDNQTNVNTRIFNREVMNNMFDLLNLARYKA